MSRFFYRCLIHLHPRAFRERFGNEMLSIFDESTHVGSAAFFVDACGSLARQWILRSGLWRFAIGAGLTALLIAGYSRAEVSWQRKQTAAQELIEAKAARPLNQAEFDREVAQAVAMLARFRHADSKQTHRLHSPQSVAPDVPSQD